MSFNPNLFFSYQALIDRLNTNNAAFSQGTVLKHNSKLYHVQVIQIETDPKALFIQIHTENEIEVRKNIPQKKVQYIGANEATFKGDRSTVKIITQGEIVSNKIVEYKGEMNAVAESFATLLKTKVQQAPVPSPESKQWMLTQKTIGGAGVVAFLLSISYIAAKNVNLTLPPAAQKRINLIKKKFEELRKSWNQIAPTA